MGRLLTASLPTGTRPIHAQSMDVPPEEKAALAALYNATGGAQWRLKEGWLGAGPACSWYRVYCSDPDGTYLHV